ncbi:regulatory GntR family protein [Lachnotalea glycerini]|uniref:GntR family transcriptional regulator n=1 Tax=Lachnotalea glycerini TaxID=1763509 RepID=A0A318ERD8_9FIRM|nr:GntR family transcriptional regulator [Lachnotalea glycerini]PXV89209.1 regulatory GntR family protein [Lachnotalea glycerini]RDY31446.1 GntR family transcriptional regulator [Lachnotalea glycerini]
MKIAIPRYQQIAADVATKIAQGYYLEGEKFYVRSSLASQYGVSSETARRAICILSDMKIVESTKGSGVLIKSKEKAVEFIHRFNNINQMSDLKEEILSNLEQQIEHSSQLKILVSEFMYKTERFQAVHPFTPFEIEVTDKAKHIGESISDLRFWHNTTATIIAIRRGEQIIISPGPYAIITLGDIIYYVGDENCHERVNNFLYSIE